MPVGSSIRHRCHEARAGESEFVGRAHALAALNAGLSAAADGLGSVVVVHGETGIGKTRTVAEFARAAERQDAVVLWGNCYERGATRSFGPWVEALEDYLGPLEPEHARDRLGHHGPVLTELLPRLRGELADQDPPPTLAPAAALIRLYEAVVGLLDSTREVPVLVIDDVHWADPDALDMLTYVARQASRLLIVLTCRGRELQLTQPAATRLAEIGRQRSCEYVLLDSLSREESAELLQQMAGQTLDPGLADALYKESGGNPYFLCELGRHLGRHGLPPDRDHWRLPETVRHAVALRLAGLSADTRSVLDFASVFTAGFGFTELLMLTELGEDRLLDALDEALAAELIRPIGPERYDYAHTLVRHVLYDRVSSSRRARLHRRLAGVLEQTLGEAPEREAELARQYHASMMLPGAERGVPHALNAARRARAAHAQSEAITLLALAREIAPATDLTLRARIESELAQAQAEAGLREDAPRTLESAVSLLEASGADGASIAELVFTVISTVQDAFVPVSDLREAVIGRGLTALGETQTLAWARLKLLKRPHEAVSAGPIHAVRWLGFDAGAVEIARREGTERDYARSLCAATPWPAGEYDELVALIGSWKTAPARLRGMSILLMYMTMQHGYGPGAGRICDEFETLADEASSLQGLALAMTYRTAILGAQGEFSAALEAAAEARGRAERIPSGSGNWVIRLLDLVEDLTTMQVHPEWVRMAEKMHGLAMDGSPWLRLLYAALAARAYTRAGMPEPARELLDYLLPVLAAGEPNDFAQSASLAFAADAVCELGDEKLAERLLPAALALVDERVGDWYMTSNELTVARLQNLQGDLESALAYFARARQTLAARDQRALLALAEHDEAQARRTARHPEAASLLAAATAHMHELGMHRGSLSGRGGRSAALPDGLTRREAEVLALVSEGRTNKEIAAQLVLSVHTVERHIQNVYRKIGVRNRADASAYAVRAGLPVAHTHAPAIRHPRRAALAAEVLD
jgi:DNA-binding CsgD family transcriptional regulator